MKYFAVTATISIAAETQEEAERIAESLHDQTHATLPNNVVLLVEDEIAISYDDGR